MRQGQSPGSGSTTPVLVGNLGEKSPPRPVPPVSSPGPPQIRKEYSMRRQVRLAVWTQEECFLFEQRKDNYSSLADPNYFARCAILCGTVFGSNPTTPHVKGTVARKFFFLLRLGV